jgi:hypothetical protein
MSHTGLSGIRVKGVKLSNKDRRVAYIIYVPRGVTSYQASDKRYYSRSEFEVKAIECCWTGSKQGF